jgi:lipopolysaccharide transport system permease protein
MENNYDLVIEPDTQNKHFWRDLWIYRELFYFLAWRDILVRYKQTAIGIAWSIIRPLMTMIVFTVVFGHIAKLPSNNTPYPVLVFAALLPWQFFVNALNESSNSLIANANLLSKIFFPRLIVPISAVIVSVVDFLITFAILGALFFWYHYSPDWRIVFLPFFVLMTLFASLGAGLWFSALNVKYRDFRFVVPFIVQVGLYISPVGFSSEVVPEKWRLVYSLNPMVGIIDGFRWSLACGNQRIYWPSVVVSASLIILILILGVNYFLKVERSLADII